jgi:hypothetical protein
MLQIDLPAVEALAEAIQVASMQVRTEGGALFLPHGRPSSLASAIAALERFTGQVVLISAVAGVEQRAA